MEHRAENDQIINIPDKNHVLLTPTINPNVAYNAINIKDDMDSSQKNIAYQQSFIAASD